MLHGIMTHVAKPVICTTNGFSVSSLVISTSSPRPSAACSRSSPDAACSPSGTSAVRYLSSSCQSEQGIPDKHGPMCNYNVQYADYSPHSIDVAQTGGGCCANACRATSPCSIAYALLWLFAHQADAGCIVLACHSCCMCCSQAQALPGL